MGVLSGRLQNRLAVGSEEKRGQKLGGRRELEFGINIYIQLYIK